MRKRDVIQLFGGSTAAAARELDITPSAISQWPDDLPPTIRDRVLAAWTRKYLVRCLPRVLRQQAAANDAPAQPAADAEVKAT